MARTRLYRNGVLEAEDFPPEEISAHLRDDALTVWLDLGAPTEADLALIASELGLHELAVEDAVHSRQRPKLDRYDTHNYLTAYSVALDPATGQLTTAELGMFVTDRAVVTVRPGGGFDIDAVMRRWDELSHLAKNGVGFLLHGLLDYVVDTHFTAVQSLDDLIEELEDTVFDEKASAPESQRRALALRKSLVTLRRVVLPMREVVNTLLRREDNAIDQAMVPYFQDVFDHVLRASEWTESLRDLVTTIRETQLSIQGNRLNLIMKKVTGWAAIIAVPTAITGFYGQNIPYPGLGQPWGFWVSAGSILLVGGGLYALFKHRDWL
ncbi:MAG: magnesium transporter CorA family protein [Actinophytocola sp.]|uniref:magnesium transporter CorA family protein n=1 Tax=Actinophytocola sp. TaxID=1872138 RepID=UPI003C74D738